MFGATRTTLSAAAAAAATFLALALDFDVINSLGEMNKIKNLTFIKCFFTLFPVFFIRSNGYQYSCNN